jgi:glycosyltransferase involved in cell wall biosynthesis
VLKASDHFAAPGYGRAVTSPRVSVICIFLDEERFLREAIDSVVAQDFTDWELLLVDDGSRDASTGIARDYATAMPDKVRCLEHSDHANRGMSAARNLGLAHAR